MTETAPAAPAAPAAWRGRARTGAIAVAGIGCALATAAMLPRQVTWSDAQAAAGPAAAMPVIAVDMAALGDTRVTLAGMFVEPGRTVDAHGIVKSGEEAVIASRMTALITALPYEAGQSFARGAMLARFDCSQLNAQLSAANAAAAAYRKTYDTNVELDQYKAIGTNEVAVSKANLGKAAAEAQAIRAGIGQCTITAPFSGTVVERIAHPHDIAASGQPLMKIQGAGDLEVELIIPSHWLTWVKPGTPFSFAVDETGGRVRGRIARLGAAVDPVSKTMRVTGSIVVQGTVLPGMSGTARFREG